MKRSARAIVHGSEDRQGQCGRRGAADQLVLSEDFGVGVRTKVRVSRRRLLRQPKASRHFCLSTWRARYGLN